ncbi:MAG: mRNA 3'-end processing factor [Halobacteriota archaeon]
MRLSGGVILDLIGGPTVRCDGAGSADVVVMSHAHVDHVVTGGPVVASELTVDLVAVRTGADLERRTHPDIDLVDAGHVPGSRAALVEDRETGETVLYTGDCCTRDRFFLDGFDPPPADVLVLEATYGRPAYQLPPTDEVVREIYTWLAATTDSVAVFTAYPLGRAQVLIRLLEDADRDRVFVSADVDAVNAPIERALDHSFDTEPLGAEGPPAPGDAVVASAGALRDGPVVDALAGVETVTAGVSGWAVDRSFTFRRSVDAGFALSDHCDFDELLDIVEAVDPEVVYTHHGFADTLAAQITRRYGLPAWSMKRSQARLDHF